MLPKRDDQRPLERCHVCRFKHAKSFYKKPFFSLHTEIFWSLDYVFYITYEVIAVSSTRPAGLFKLLLAGCSLLGIWQNLFVKWKNGSTVCNVTYIIAAWGHFLPSASSNRGYSCVRWQEWGHRLNDGWSGRQAHRCILVILFGLCRGTEESIGIKAGTQGKKVERKCTDYTDCCCCCCLHVVCSQSSHRMNAKYYNVATLL